MVLPLHSRPIFMTHELPLTSKQLAGVGWSLGQLAGACAAAAQQARTLSGGRTSSASARGGGGGFGRGQGSGAAAAAAPGVAAADAAAPLAEALRCWYDCSAAAMRMQLLLPEHLAVCLEAVQEVVAAAAGGSSAGTGGGSSAQKRQPQGGASRKAAAANAALPLPAPPAMWVDAATVLLRHCRTAFPPEGLAAAVQILEEVAAVGGEEAAAGQLQEAPWVAARVRQRIDERRAEPLWDAPAEGEEWERLKAAAAAAGGQRES